MIHVTRITRTLWAARWHTLVADGKTESEAIRNLMRLQKGKV